MPVVICEYCAVFGIGAIRRMRVNHQHLRAFHAVAIEGSISRAARRLNVAQPTLSQQLKALEQRHQTALFEGRKQPLRLTFLGQRLFDLTQKLFATSQDIDELLDDGQVERTALVRLGSDSPVYAVRIAAALREKLPGISLRVRIGNAPETFSWLSQAEIDIGIVSDPPADEAFAYEPLFNDRLIVALPKNHSRANDLVFPVAALAQERLLMRDATSRTRAAIEELLQTVDVTPAGLIELHTRETIREGVAIGLGLSLFTSSECPPDERIVYLPLDIDPSASRMTGYVVCLAERRRTSLMRALMEAAAELRLISPLPVYATRTRPLARDVHRAKTEPAIMFESSH